MSEPCFQFYDHINVLIKPTEGCNLRCRYCFHQDYGYQPAKLTMEHLRRFFEITMPHYKSMLLIWHGGEPTFVGAAYFRQCADMASDYAARYGVALRQTMQTNGTLLTEEFIDVLRSHHISIGVSYDGPVNQQTRGSTDALAVVNRRLSEHGINYGTIAVVSGLNVHQLPELYQHMKALHKDFQLNPYIDTSADAPADLAMSADEYVAAMRQLFALWLHDEACDITVDPFTRMIRDVYVGRSSLCSRSSCMRNWLCLNADGQLSPCDRHFPAEYCYGSVDDLDDVRQIYQSAGYMNLMRKAIARRKLCQEQCDVYALCEGGCNNNALYEGGLEKNGGFSCTVTKALLHMVRDATARYDLFGPAPQTENPTLLKALRALKEKDDE